MNQLLLFGLFYLNLFATLHWEKNISLSKHFTENLSKGKY